MSRRKCGSIRAYYIAPDPRKKGERRIPRDTLEKAIGTLFRSTRKILSQSHNLHDLFYKGNASSRETSTRSTGV